MDTLTCLAMTMLIPSDSFKAHHHRAVTAATMSNLIYLMRLNAL